MTRPGPGHRARRLVRRLWRQLQRLERPRQALAPWRRRDSAAVLLTCLLVALLSSWPWLVEPSLRPGVPATATLRAPKAATVVDSEALEQRRNQLGPRSHVQVVDPRINHELEQRLERQLLTLSRVADNPRDQVAPLQLSPAERLWLSELPAADLAHWKLELQHAHRRMLQQGLVGSVARQQLEQAADLQLETLVEPGRSLGSRLLANNLQGRSNLRIDAALTQRLIEDLLTQQGIPTIHVSRGELITRQGEPISAQSYAVLDYFGLVNRRPLLGAWLLHASEALLGAVVMVMVIRRNRASLEPRQALLALGLLLIVQGCKLWFGAAVSPLALLVPPTLLLAQGLGTSAGLAWLAADRLLIDRRPIVVGLLYSPSGPLAASERSISARTAFVRPSAPMMTTGFNACASERSSDRWAGVRMRAGINEGEIAQKDKRRVLSAKISPSRHV